MALLVITINMTTKGPGLTIVDEVAIVLELHIFMKEDFWAHNTVLYSKVFHNSYPKFVYYLFKSFDFKSFDGGSAVPTLNRNHVHPTSIKVPVKITEQEEIAEVLSSLDDKIDLLHRQNKTLEQLAETLFRQWFGGENKTGTIGEYVKIQGGYAFKSNSFKAEGFAGIIKITNISMSSVDILKTDFVDEEVVKNIDENKFRIRSGDFLIAMTGAEIGKIGIVENTSKQIWLNQRVGRLMEKVPFGNLVGYIALKSREGQDHIMNACSGSAQENISTTGLEEMEFVSYSKERTDSFGKDAKPLFEKITFNHNQIRTLTQLRDTLLPKLMSGEVRVKMN